METLENRSARCLQILLTGMILVVTCILIGMALFARNCFSLRLIHAITTTDCRVVCRVLSTQPSKAYADFHN